MIALDVSTHNDESEEEQNDTLRNLKKSLSKLILNTIDEFEVLYLAQKLHQDVSECFGFSQQKYLVQKAILEHIIKYEETELYKRLLEETEKNLQKKKAYKYLCCLAGCLYQADKHRQYMQHLKRVHSTHNALACKFMHRCNRQFSTIDLLFEHVKVCHSTARTTVTQHHAVRTTMQVPCKCDMISCRGLRFPDTNNLITHFVNFHDKEARECIFEGCGSKFQPYKSSSVRHHISNKHRKTNNLQLKSRCLVTPHPQLFTELESDATAEVDLGDVEVESVNEECETYTEEEIGEIFEDAHSDENEGDEDCEFYMMQYADFLNRLSHFNHVPYKTVQEISKEYLENSMKSKDLKEKKLRLSLKKVPGMTEEFMDSVVRDVIENDQFLKAQQSLNTEYKRTKFVQEHFKYIEPVEIVLNKAAVAQGQAKDVVHYIPVTDSFQNLLEDRTFIEVVERERDNKEISCDALKDLTDGDAFKKSEFFKSNPGAYAAHFYSDSVELTNPLGAAKGKHKINQVFYTLVQIPRDQRSRIDRIQLAMVFKDKLVKKYGYNLIFQKLISDLLKLEIGIKITKPIERHVQMGVLAYSADNLEAHSLGGFSCCFSSKDICRFCHASYEDLGSQIHDYGEKSHHYWSINEYDNICDALEEGLSDEEATVDCTVTDENLFFQEGGENNEESDHEVDSDSGDVSENEEDLNQTCYGLKKRCPLNKLSAFHCIVNFPPDFMHDHLEGVAAQDLFGVIKILLHQEEFNLDDYNERLKNFPFSGHEAADKPHLVPSKGNKLPGKALSLLVHLRNFPLIIKYLAGDSQNEIIRFALLLVDITLRLTAAEIRPYEISILEDKIVEYLDRRKEILAEYPDILGTAKPKVRG